MPFFLDLRATFVFVRAVFPGTLERYMSDRSEGAGRAPHFRSLLSPAQRAGARCLLLELSVWVVDLALYKAF